jgi:nicotinamide-nucleotide amidase
VKAEILTIGDELLLGEIVDTNKSFLSERLLRLEIQTRFHASVRDDPEDMTDAFRRAASRSDVVLVSGGLGPTRDDLTLEVLASTFGRKLVLHAPSLEAMRAFFARFGREMAPINEKQAWLPEGADVLPNPIGTAPGCALEAGGALFFCLPGVPRELERMMDEQVLPRLAAPARRASGAVVRSALLRTFGMGESNLDAELADLGREEGLVIGFRTAFPDNYLRPVARGASAEEADARLAKLVEAIRARLGPLVYGTDEQTMESVVLDLLRARGRRLAVAESCSGGLVAERLTSVPGASDVFRGGVVAYSNDVKRDVLGVPAALLAEHGAVSQPVAAALARGARERLGADLAVATTGISGPGGGSAEKPVGLVCVGFAGPEGAEAREFLFPFDRVRHRMVTSQVALDWVRRALLGIDPVALRYLQTGARSVGAARRAEGERSREEGR